MSSSSEQQPKPLAELVRSLIKQDRVSEVFLQPGQFVGLKKNGQIHYCEPRVTEFNFRELIALRELDYSEEGWSTEKVRDEPFRDREFVIPVENRRLRCSLLRHEGGWRLVIRPVPARIRTPEELLIPSSFVEHVKETTEGLILAAGSAGNGKTTTIASIIQYLVVPRNCHIMTIEDPIEYDYKFPSACVGEPSSLLTRRQYKRDFQSFAELPQAIVRQGVDVLVVGEIRDQWTAELALNASGAGCLVFGTLHANGVGEAFQRLIQLMGPQHNEDAILKMLSMIFKGVIWQELRPHINGIERVPIHQVLIANSKSVAVRSGIRDKKWQNLEHEMEHGKERGQWSYRNSVRERIKEEMLAHFDYEYVLKE